MATYEIVEKQGLKMVKATIDNETIRAEAGALHYMRGLIELETPAPTAKGFLKSMVTQEKIFRPTYTGTGEIFYGPPTFGEYTIMRFDNEEWVLDKGAYVCSDHDIEVGVFTNKAISGLISGEGFFQTKVSGCGTVVIHSYGPLETVELNNERLSVDGKFAVARQAHLNFNVRKATKGVFGSIASGEGLLNVIEGTGRVLLAPVPNLYMNLIHEVRSCIPASTS